MYSLNHVSLCLTLIVLLIVEPGCGDTVASDGKDEVGDGDGDPTTGAGDGDSTGYVDQVPCDPEGCTSDADCCKSPVAVCGALASYANRWTCVSGDCVHGGCINNADCWSSGLNEKWECHMIGSKKFCIHPCFTDADCVAKVKNQNTKCIGTTTTNTMYCAEEPIDP